MCIRDSNPCSLILSAVMMLEHLGWQEAAASIVGALETTLAQNMATPDLARFMDHGTALGTKEFADELVRNIGTQIT